MNWPLLQNSLLLAAAATAVACSFGFVAALFAAGLSPRGRNWFIGVAVVTLALPPFLVVNCWLHLFGAAGVWRSLLPLNIYSFQGAALILGILMWPVPMLAVWSAWRRLEAPRLEADMAVRGWSLVRGLLFPMARPAFVQGALLTFVLALNNFAVPTILQVKVFSSEVWIRFSTNFDPLGALFVAWPLIAVPFLLVVLMSRKEFPWPRLAASIPGRLLRDQLGRGVYWLAAVLSLALGCVSVGLPLVEALSFTRTWTELPGALAAGRSALWNSFVFSSCAAVLVTAASVFGLGLLMASRERRNNRVATGLGWCLWLPFLVPGVFLGIALIFLMNNAWFRALYVSPAVVLLAFTIRYSGIAWNPVLHAFSGTDPELSDAARVEGAGRVQIVRHVLWPQCVSQVLVTAYIVFLLTLWDVESIVLIYPPGGETLSLRVFNLLHYGHNPEVNALCLLLVFLALAPLVLFQVAILAARNAPRLFVRPAVAAVLVACAASGCAPEPVGQTRLESRLFVSVNVVGSRGAGLGQFVKPRSVAVDSADNVYVEDMTGRVQKFSSNGVFSASWQMPQTDIGKPKGMCRDPEGNIVVLEPHYQRVSHFTPSGDLVLQWGRSGTNIGEFTLPRAVAFNSRREAFVSEYGPLDRVQSFSADGKNCLGSFGGRAGSAPGEFNRPEGLCIDREDRVYVADSCNHRIQVFSSEGKLLRVYGKAGSGKGELSYPYDICVDAAGRQYVCEFGNSRIQVFDAADRPVEVIGGPGAAPGRFSNPWGVAIDSAGNLYVADSQNHRVQKLIKRPETVAAK